jgi:hypothetical protein
MNQKAMMLKYYRDGLTSDDFESGSDMNYALYAYEHYGDATRDNTFEQMVALGKTLEIEQSQN